MGYSFSEVTGAALLQRTVDRRAAGQIVGVMESAKLALEMLLRSLRLDELECLAASLQPVRAAPGQVIVRQGEPGRLFYVIASGSVQERDQSRCDERSQPGRRSIPALPVRSFDTMGKSLLVCYGTAVAGTMERLARVAATGTIQLTTFGRKTGKSHRVPVWFVAEPPILYLTTLKMKRDWPKNVRANGKVQLDIAGERFMGRARYVEDPTTFDHVKKLLADKYWAAWIGGFFGLRPEGVFRVDLDPQ